MTRTTDLSDMPIDAAVSVMKRKMDAEFAMALARQEAAMVRDGLSRDTIEGLLDHHIKRYFAQRNAELDEIESWLRSCDRRLH